MNIKTVLKTSVAAAALVAVAAPVAAGVESGNKNSLTMSGQIARSLIYANNGNASELFNTDGIDTNTRLRWIASGQLTESVTVGGVVEMNFPLSNNGYTLGDTTSTESTTSSGTSWDLRKTEVTFLHKAAGKLSIGQGSAAGDGASTQSLGSWGPSMDVRGAGGTGSSLYNNADTDTLVTDLEVGGTVGQYDPSREDRIRYDTPSFGGLSLAVSYGTLGGGSSVGAGYSGKFGGINVSAGAFYYKFDSQDGDVDGRLGGSVAAKHDSGFSAHLGYTKEDSRDGAVEGKEWHGGVGYAASLTNLGTTGFAINYSRSDDAVENGDEGTVFGIAVNQNLAAVGTDVFLAYNRYTYEDTSAVDYDDFSSIMAGTRMNF